MAINTDDELNDLFTQLICDIIIDVCQGCGAYYEANERNKEIWIESCGGVKPTNSVQPQRCNKCMKE